MSPLLSDKISGVFVYILTGKGKYPVQGFENLELRNEMQLSGKRKTFARIFVGSLESTSDFERFERKDDRHS